MGSLPPLDRKCAAQNALLCDSSSSPWPAWRHLVGALRLSGGGAGPCPRGGVELEAESEEDEAGDEAMAQRARAVKLPGFCCVLANEEDELEPTPEIN
ncbi:hypothetical protein ACP70R_015334 [Stipagrostis hirtigluma subsp. patula]